MLNKLIGLAMCMAIGVGSTALACEGEEVPQQGAITSLLCQFHPVHAENGMCTPLQAVVAGRVLGQLIVNGAKHGATVTGRPCDLVDGDENERGDCDRSELIAAIEQEVRTIGCNADGSGLRAECNHAPDVDVFGVTCVRYGVRVEECKSVDLVATMGTFEQDLYAAAKDDVRSVSVPFAQGKPAVTALATLVSDRLRLRVPDAFRHLWPENRTEAPTTTAMKQ